MASKVDVLFIHTHVNGCYSDTYNFGIGYLSSVLKENGFSTMLVVCKAEKDYQNVLDAVSEHNPKVIGFSSVSSQFVYVSRLAKEIRGSYGGVIVCGGVHPTIFPDCLSSNPYFDGFFIGESEFPFMDFVTAVIKGNDYKGTDNFCYVYNGRLVKNKLRQRIKDLAQLPFPDRDMVDYQLIIDQNDGAARLIPSRGCPFYCTYCSNHAIARAYGEERNLPRFNSVERVLAEISMLKSRFRFSELYFVDDLFISNRTWLNEFLSEYKKRFDIPYMCQVRPDICTRDIIFRLKESGCHKIFVAIESANDHIRNVVMKRNISKDQLRNTFMWAREAGIQTLSANIIGVPGETEETVLETIDFNRQVHPTITGVNIFSPYEGTQLWDYCRKHGLLKETNSSLFLDRRQTRLILPTIRVRKLMKYFDEFQFLVYQDIDPVKARHALLQMWGRRYGALERIAGAGFVFRRLRKVFKWIGVKVLFGIREAKHSRPLSKVSV